MEFENITWKLASILFGHQCVKTGEATNRKSRVGTQYKSLAVMYGRCYMTLSVVVRNYVYMFRLYWIYTCMNIFKQFFYWVCNRFWLRFTRCQKKIIGPCSVYSSFWVWAQPMRDKVTMSHRLSLDEPIPKMIPVNSIHFFPKLIIIFHSTCTLAREIQIRT